MKAIFIVTPLLAFGKKCLDYSITRDGIPKLAECGLSKLERRNMATLFPETTVTQPQSKLQIKVDCEGEQCNEVHKEASNVAKFVSNVFKFKHQMRVHLKFYSFCKEKHECVKNPTVGSSMPSNSFLREDEDGIVRGFPQALYKEKGFVGWDDSLKEFDILIDMNSDIKYHFLTNSKEDKRTDEVSFAESLMHEINHGLGFASSISDYGYGFPTPAPSNEAIPVFYEFYFDKFLYVRETQLIKYTNYLNYYFQHHPRLSKSTDSLSRVEALKNFYKISSTPGILKFIASNGQRITLDTTNTSPKGASVSHLDDNYTNTRDFMMVSVARVEQLSSFNFSDSAWKFKPYGENTILILKTLGYTFKAPDQTNPISKYFNPVSINPRPKRTISKSYRLRPKSKRTISKSYRLRPKSKRPKKYRKVKVRFIRRKRLG